MTKTIALADQLPHIRNVYCIGRNYINHIKELKNEQPAEPVVFLKSTASLRGCSPAPMGFAETFAHEVELVLLVGDEVRMGEAPGWNRIAGLGLGLDLTRRSKQDDLKAKGLPWTVAKSFAGAAVLSDFVAAAQFPDLGGIGFYLEVNGERRQTGNTAQMIWSPLELLRYLASMQTLFPGDLVFTGTPEGVGPIASGDRFRIGFVQPEIAYDGQL